MKFNRLAAQIEFVETIIDTSSTSELTKDIFNEFIASINSNAVGGLLPLLTKKNKLSKDFSDILLKQKKELLTCYIELIIKMIENTSNSQVIEELIVIAEKALNKSPPSEEKIHLIALCLYHLLREEMKIPKYADDHLPLSEKVRLNDLYNEMREMYTEKIRKILGNSGNLFNIVNGGRLPDSMISELSQNFKKILHDHIIQMNSSNEKKLEILNRTLNPKASLGKFFYTQRGFKAPSIKSGNLKSLHEEKLRIETLLGIHPKIQNSGKFFIGNIAREVRNHILKEEFSPASVVGSPIRLLPSDESDKKLEVKNEKLDIIKEESKQKISTSSSKAQPKFFNLPEAPSNPLPTSSSKRLKKEEDGNDTAEKKPVHG